ncbi:hypothetical protein [Streptacidiphilus sp. PAMC 29251]
MARTYTLSAAGRESLAANAAKGTAAAQSVDSLINRLVAKAPPLTDEQRAKLARLLRPAGGASE